MTQPMRVGVVGAGAIGGYVAAHLALAGQRVTVVARGANLDAIRAGGITLIEDGQTRVADVAAAPPGEAIGPQDLVIVAVKAHQLAAVAPACAALFGPDTPIVTMQNGIPYWYFSGLPGDIAGRTLDSVDPGGAIAAQIPSQRVIGCVVYPATELDAPGVVRHVEGNRFPLGELDGATTPRIERVSQAFEAAGLKAPILANIRDEIWLKLWGNLVFNPVSALTRATLVDICRNPQTRALSAAMMAEAQAVGEKLGVHFRVSIERRMAGAERVGAHKTSMLQDLEAGRELEIDALLGSVVELGRLTDTPTPRLEAVYALVKGLAP
jgi:2-dehydropantoate 2-reductase